MNRPGDAGRRSQRVFETRWFTVLEEDQPGGDPYYMLELPDYVSVVALTPAREMLLVRQFRPVAARDTLELPSGHVDPGETPEAAIRRELLEETGHVATQLDLLGTLVPDVGRLRNRMWCYFAAGVRPADAPHQAEAGVTVVSVPERDAIRMAMDGTIDHALNLAPLFLALAGGRLSLSSGGTV
jgi:8-oxo-dGTP pyrophosphatase MutT (NUDIX family)